MTLPTWDSLRELSRDELMDLLLQLAATAHLAQLVAAAVARSEDEHTQAEAAPPPGSQSRTCEG